MARGAVILGLLVAAQSCAGIAGQNGPLGPIKGFMERLGNEGPSAVVDTLKNENTLHFGVGVVAGYTALATIKGLGRALMNVAIGGALVAFLISRNSGHPNDFGIGVSVDTERIKQNFMDMADLDKSGHVTLEDVEGGFKMLWAKVRPLIVKFHYVAVGVGTGVAMAFFH